MQPAIMIEQVYSRHNYTNYPDAYYDMCNGKAEFPKCSGLVKKPVYCGISYGHTYRMGKGKFMRIQEPYKEKLGYRVKYPDRGFFIAFQKKPHQETHHTTAN